MREIGNKKMYWTASYVSAAASVTEAGHGGTLTDCLDGFWEVLVAVWQKWTAFFVQQGAWIQKVGTPFNELEVNWKF